MNIIVSLNKSIHCVIGYSADWCTPLKSSGSFSYDLIMSHSISAA